MDENIKSFAEMLAVDYNTAKYFYEKANGNPEIGILVIFTFNSCKYVI